MKAGAVKFADTPDEAAAHFDAILPILVIGPARALGARRGEVADRAGVLRLGHLGRARASCRCVLFSDMGGIDIEEVAEKHPEHVSKTHFSTILPLSPRIAKEAIGAVGVTGNELNKLTPIVFELMPALPRLRPHARRDQPARAARGRPLHRARRPRRPRGRGARQARGAARRARHRRRGDAPGAPADARSRSRAAR